MSIDWSDQIVVAELGDEPALSDELSELLDRLESAATPPHVVLSFSGVTYVNSSNLAQLLRVRKVLAASGRSVRLCSVSKEVWSVMAITGLDKVFQFAPDPMTALAGLQLEADPSE
ncbi:MAG: STAS domain-containing protein [Phycisphaeraceae bacterium]|nr:STAS domain-containing protein [Phycisphaeraceae bacterium]